jgi:hypothetical protein
VRSGHNAAQQLMSQLAGIGPGDRAITGDTEGDRPRWAAKPEGVSS